MAKATTILNCLNKARKLQPEYNERPHQPAGVRRFWVAGSTTAYSVRVEGSRVTCEGNWRGECKGYENTGCCYHAAWVAINEGLLTEDIEDRLVLATTRLAGVAA